jgi:hypothetical protein
MSSAGTLAVTLAGVFPTGFRNARFGSVGLGVNRYPLIRTLSTGSGPSPQCQGDAKRIDLDCIPPDPLIADPMQFAVVQATEWDSKFVTDLAPHCPRLGKAKVMGVDRCPATYQARLLRYKFAMFRVPEANGFG